VKRWPLVLCAALACKRAAPPSQPTLFGGERGLDHVGIVVNDLAEAQRTFHDRLGFGAMEAGKVANGIENVNYYFEDSTYLETLRGGSFAGRPEGAAFAALSVASAAQTAAFLAARGIRTGAPIAGSIKTARASDDHWQTMFFEGSPLPRDPVFFIEYAQPARRDTLDKLRSAVQAGRVYKHPNGALGVKAVWLAVPDLAAAVKSFEAAGLAAGAEFAERRLGAAGCAIDAGEGKILLVAPAAADGAVAEFLSRRGGPGLLGVSIEVSLLGLAQRFAVGATGKPALPAPGALGQSVFIEPAVAHGAWLEFVQR